MAFFFSLSPPLSSILLFIDSVFFYLFKRGLFIHLSQHNWMCAWGTGISFIHTEHRLCHQIISREYRMTDSEWEYQRNGKTFLKKRWNKRIKDKKFKCEHTLFTVRRRCQLFKQIETETEMFKHFNHGPKLFECIVF